MRPRCRGEASGRLGPPYGFRRVSSRSQGRQGGGSGNPAAGVVPPQDLEGLQERDRCMAELRETMDEMRQALRAIPRRNSTAR